MSTLFIALFTKHCLMFQTSFKVNKKWNDFCCIIVQLRSAL